MRDFYRTPKHEQGETDFCNLAQIYAGVHLRALEYLADDAVCSNGEVCGLLLETVFNAWGALSLMGSVKSARLCLKRYGPTAVETLGVLASSP